MLPSVGVLPNLLVHMAIPLGSNLLWQELLQVPPEPIQQLRPRGLGAAGALLTKCCGELRLHMLHFRVLVSIVSGQLPEGLKKTMPF